MNHILPKISAFAGRLMATISGARFPRRFGLALALAAMAPGAPAFATPPPAPADAFAKACASSDGWTDPAPPVPIYANTWYVGTCGITAVLIRGDDGMILIDGGVREAAPLVLADIAALGFRPRDVRWILSTHEHYDHAGALAALKLATGAKVAALASEKAALETGRMSPDDPQAKGGERIEPVRVDRVIAPGGTVSLGNLTLTAHATPAHAPGSTSWTWRACLPGGACRSIAYADSATVIASKGYRFTDHPRRVSDARTAISLIAALPCDILVTPHPSASNLVARLSGKAPLVDRGACAAYAATARTALNDRLAGELSEAGAKK